MEVSSPTYLFHMCTEGPKWLRLLTGISLIVTSLLQSCNPVFSWNWTYNWKNPESAAASLQRAAMAVNPKAYVHSGFDLNFSFLSFTLDITGSWTLDGNVYIRSLVKVLHCDWFGRQHQGSWCSLFKHELLWTELFHWHLMNLFKKWRWIDLSAGVPVLPHLLKTCLYYVHKYSSATVKHLFEEWIKAFTFEDTF